MPGLTGYQAGISRSKTNNRDGHSKIKLIAIHGLLDYKKSSQSVKSAEASS
jgi:hypothetical protein